MKVKLLTCTPGGEQLIATAGRVCYSPSDVEQLQESITPEKVVEMINKLGKSGHTSTFEHVSFTFAVEGCSRSLSHQLVRNRIGFSFSQQSQRYVKETMFDYIVPETVVAAGMKEKFEERMKIMQEWYTEALGAGIPAEDARFYLPNAAETKIIITMNARSLMNFFKERLCCFDKETEVLTESGWKFFKDVSDSDLIYSLNENNDCEYSKIKERFEYDYNGNMIRVKSQSIDNLITPNHKMFVSYSYDNKRFVLDRAENHKENKRILMKKNCNPIAGKIEEYFELPGVVGILKDHDKRNVKIDNFFKFLGFYISDGYVYKSGQHYNVGVCKGDEDVTNKYVEILKSLTNNSVRKYKDKSCWKIEVHDRVLYEFLKKLGGALDKHIPSFVWKYDHSLLKNILEGLYDGDTGKKSNIYYTSSKRLADDYQRLMLHLGFSGTLTPEDRIGQRSRGIDSTGSEYDITTKNISYRISRNVSKNEPIIKTKNRDSFSEEFYDGKIYCLELEKNNILHVRRNGKTVWSGNSRAQWEIRALAEEMYRQVVPILPTVSKFYGPHCHCTGKCTQERPCGKFAEVTEKYRKQEV